MSRASVGRLDATLVVLNSSRKWQCRPLGKHAATAPGSHQIHDGYMGLPRVKDRSHTKHSGCSKKKHFWSAHPHCFLKIGSVAKEGKNYLQRRITPVPKHLVYFLVEKIVHNTDKCTSTDTGHVIFRIPCLDRETFAIV